MNILPINPTPKTFRTDLTGRPFGRLTVLGYSHKRLKPSGSPSYFWICRCSCGTVKPVDASGLKSGAILSCGCLQKEAVSNANKTHGMSRINGLKNPTFESWTAMMQRCANPRNQAYKRYGERGITVCDRWLEYLNFLEDMGERPSKEMTIERLDNDKGYSPENCIWAPMSVQNVNRSNTVWLTLNGERKHLLDWSKITGISLSTLGNRHRRGWSDEDVLLRPLNKHWSSKYGYKRE